MLNRTCLPSDAIAFVVFCRLRYQMILRDLSEILWLRGIEVSWYADETYLKVRGCWRYLCRAIGRDGNLIDATLSEHRGMKAAKAFFRSPRTVMGYQPDRVTGRAAVPTRGRSAPDWAGQSATVPAPT